jgi:hypothetical protein
MLVTPEQSGFVNLCITEKVSVGFFRCSTFQGCVSFIQYLKLTTDKRVCELMCIKMTI